MISTAAFATPSLPLPISLSISALELSYSYSYTPLLLTMTLFSLQLIYSSSSPSTFCLLSNLFRLSSDCCSSNPHSKFFISLVCIVNMHLGYLPKVLGLLFHFFPFSMGFCFKPRTKNDGIRELFHTVSGCELQKGLLKVRYRPGSNLRPQKRVR